MGRKAGGKNYSNITNMAELPDDIKPKLAEIKDIFTCFDKDFISVEDLQECAGVSYTTGCQMIREIKAASDIFKIRGVVHRVDYYIFISKRSYCENENTN